MKTIHKAVLDLLKVTDGGLGPHVVIETPTGAELLTVQMQYGTPCVWYKCDPAQGVVSRRVFVFGTGHELSPYIGKYLGTAVLPGGQMVLHFFEEKGE